MNKPELTIQDLVDGLNEALDLLSMSGPNPMFGDSKEYWERVSALQDKFIPEELE